MGKEDIIKLILSQSKDVVIDIDLKDDNGNTAEDLARERGLTDVIMIFHNYRKQRWREIIRESMPIVSDDVVDLIVAYMPDSQTR
jgi:hypothetical protein